MVASLRGMLSGSVAAWKLGCDIGEMSELAEGARLLSEYTGLNLYRGFNSLSLRQIYVSCSFKKAQNPIYERILSLLHLSGCSIIPLDKP